MENLNTLSLASLIKAEGLDVEVLGNLDFIPDRLRSVKHVGTMGSVVYYTGDDSIDVSHLYGCLLICKPSLPVKANANNLTLIKTDNPKLAFAIVANRFEWPKPEIQVGLNVVIEKGVVLGKIGIGYVWGYNGKKWKMPQIGGLVIGDDCFIGANTCIAHGALEHTSIGSGTMIASGVGIGHNCNIGEECFIGTNAVLGGSVEIGDYSWIGLGAIVNPQVKLGSRVVVGSGSVVTKSFDKDSIIIAGNPARFVRRISLNEKMAGMPAYEF